MSAPLISVRPVNEASRLLEGWRVQHWMEIDRGLFGLHAYRAGVLNSLYVPIDSIEAKKRRRLNGRILIRGLIFSFSGFMILAFLGVLIDTLLGLSESGNDIGGIYFSVAAICSLIYLIAELINFLIPKAVIHLEWTADEEIAKVEYWMPRKKRELLVLAEKLIKNKGQLVGIAVEPHFFEIDWSFTRPVRMAFGVASVTFLSIMSLASILDRFIQRHDAGLWLMVVILLLSGGSAIFAFKRAIRVNRGRGRSYLQALEAIVSRDLDQAEQLARSLFQEKQDDPLVLYYLIILYIHRREFSKSADCVSSLPFDDEEERIGAVNQIRELEAYWKLHPAM